jgi:sterol desaturase/sphingolipid hydroxylase (fatty acid hydroxylase superfamily)
LHCRYDFGAIDHLPLVGSLAHFHDWHHKVCIKNYGVFGILDWAHGTDTGYYQYLEKWAHERERENLKRVDVLKIKLTSSGDKKDI